MEDFEIPFGGCITPIIIALILFILMAVVPLNLVWGNGEHNGYVTAVDTYNSPSSRTTKVYFKTDLQSSQEDEYCINNKDTGLINKVKEALKKNGKVILKYENVSFGGWFGCSGDTIREVIEE